MRHGKTDHAKVSGEPIFFLYDHKSNRRTQAAIEWQ